MSFTKLQKREKSNSKATPFTGGFRPTWNMQIPERILQKKIFEYQNKFIAINSPNGIFKVPNHKTETWEMLWKPSTSEIAAIQPGYQKSNPVVMLSDGAICRWNGANEVQKVGNSDFFANNSSVYGLSGNRILVRQKDSLAIYAQESLKQEWKIEARVGNFTIENQILYIKENLGSHMHAFDLESYRKLWSASFEKGELTSFIGIQKEVIWTNALKGKLIGLDASNGKLCQDISLKNNHNPSGILGNDGKYHVCNGFNYEIVDLKHGVKLSHYVLINQCEAISTARGNQCILINENDLIFFDDQGKLFQFKGKDGKLKGPLWRSKNMISSYGFHEGLLYVMDVNGTITALE